MEMAEEKLGERSDMNVLNILNDDLQAIDKETYKKKIEKIANGTTGKLIFKEYPTGQAHAGHFRAFLQELKVKRGIVPDVIIIDYYQKVTKSQNQIGAANHQIYQELSNILDKYYKICLAPIK